MAGRIRSIKPEVLDDEVAAALPDAAWRLWVSLWVLADDYGNARAGEKYLAAVVWQDTGRDVREPLQKLVERGLVEAYAVAGQRYVHIRGWEKHQRVDNAGKPRVPGPDQDDGTWNRQLMSVFAETRGESGEPPLRAYARPRIPAAGPPTSDLRPTNPSESARAPASVRAKSNKDATGEATPPSIRGIDRESASRGATTHLPDDFALTPERRSYAEIAGLQTIEDVFKKFRQIAIEKLWRFDHRGWDTRWQRFVDDECKYQRKERERERDRASSVRRAAEPVPIAPPRMTREERARRAREEREAVEARKNGFRPTTPPELAELLNLGAVGGKGGGT